MPTFVGREQIALSSCELFRVSHVWFNGFATGFSIYRNTMCSWTYSIEGATSCYNRVTVNRCIVHLNHIRSRSSPFWVPGSFAAKIHTKLSEKMAHLTVAAWRINRQIDRHTECRTLQYISFSIWPSTSGRAICFGSRSYRCTFISGGLIECCDGTTRQCASTKAQVKTNGASAVRWLVLPGKSRIFQHQQVKCVLSGDGIA